MMSYEGATYLCCINIQHTTEWSWKVLTILNNEMHERIWLWMGNFVIWIISGIDMMCHFLRPDDRTSVVNNILQQRCSWSCSWRYQWVFCNDWRISHWWELNSCTHKREGYKLSFFSGYAARTQISYSRTGRFVYI